MEKLTNDQYTWGMNIFLKILEHQPNLMSQRQPAPGTGNAMAETAAAFIDRLVELRNERVEKSPK